MILYISLIIIYFIFNHPILKSLPTLSLIYYCHHFPHLIFACVTAAIGDYLLEDETTIRLGIIFFSLTQLSLFFFHVCPENYNDNIPTLVCYLPFLLVPFYNYIPNFNIIFIYSQFLIFNLIYSRRTIIPATLFIISDAMVLANMFLNSTPLRWIGLIIYWTSMYLHTTVEI